MGNIIYVLMYNIFVVLQLYGEVGSEGDKGREIRKEFFYDYSYWSVNPKDPHFIEQETVSHPFSAFQLCWNLDFTILKTISFAEQILCLYTD